VQRSIFCLLVQPRLLCHIIFNRPLRFHSSRAQQTSRPVRLRSYLKNFEKLYQQNLDARARIEQNAQRPRRRRVQRMATAPDDEDDCDDSDESDRSDEMVIKDETDISNKTDTPDDTDEPDIPHNTDVPDNTDTPDNTDVPVPPPCLPPVCGSDIADSRPSILECQNIPEGTIVSKWFFIEQADGSPPPVEWCRGDVMPCHIWPCHVTWCYLM
jgi:hypothetical protein